MEKAQEVLGRRRTAEVPSTEGKKVKSSRRQSPLPEHGASTRSPRAHLEKEIVTGESILKEARELEDRGELDRAYSKYLSGLRPLHEMLQSPSLPGSKKAELTRRVNVYLQRAEKLNEVLKRLPRAQDGASRAESSRSPRRRSEHTQSRSWAAHSRRSPRRSSDDSSLGGRSMVDTQIEQSSEWAPPEARQGTGFAYPVRPVAKSMLRAARASAQGPS